MRSLLFSILLSTLAAGPVINYAMAKPVLVGTCLPNLKTYPTISQAVSAVSPGSTVLVCPGNYPEQVTITQSLTLRGVESANSVNPVLVVPQGGLTQSISSPINGIQIFFQILVNGTDSSLVKISNIAVDGENNGVPQGAGLAGIYYVNSSGMIDRVAVHRQFANRAGHGILVDSSTSSSKTITVSNSSVHDYDAEGIRTSSGPPPSPLTVDIHSNSVISSESLSGDPVSGGIDSDAAGKIWGNRVLTGPQPLGTSSGVGISVASGMTIARNTVAGYTIGIGELGDSNTIKENRVSLAEGGIGVSGRNNVVQYNSILDVVHGGDAIGFNCTGTSNVVTHNVINDSYWGIIDDHGNNVLTPNSFSNVTKIVSPPC
jgi:hypothetical protein